MRATDRAGRSPGPGARGKTCTKREQRGRPRDNHHSGKLIGLLQWGEWGFQPPGWKRDLGSPVAVDLGTLGN